jgi:transposase
MRRVFRHVLRSHLSAYPYQEALPLVGASLLKQVAIFDRAIRRLAKTDDTARRLMTVPRVGPVVALAYMAVIDDPGRFNHARDVGAYLGLTPQRYQSGEVDLAGRISKCGDGFARTCLFEAAGVLLISPLSPDS